MNRLVMLLIVLISAIFITGCNSQKIDGGDGTLNSVTTTTETRPDGTIVQTTTQTNLVIHQNDNPEKPTSVAIVINKEGISLHTTFGAAQNIAKIIASMNLLEIPMYCGLGLIVIGALVAFVIPAPFGNTKWGLVFIAIGGIMAIGSYLLAEYSVYFLIGLGVIAVWILWFIYTSYFQYKANVEIVDTIQTGKKLGVIDPEKYKNLANEKLSDKTINYIKTVKDKNKIK